MAKNCKDCTLHPFWIKVEEKDLTASFATTWDPKKDISYICEEHEGEEGFNLSDWFYSTVKKMRDMEKAGELFVLDIRAYPHDKFHYCEKDRVQDYKSSECTEQCEDQ